MNKLNLTTPRRLRVAMLILSTLASMLILTGCETSKTVVIPSDKAAKAMHAGQPYTPAVDGWFVPNARMLEILDSLDKARINGQ